jgi:hypothetical protein
MKSSVTGIGIIGAGRAGMIHARNRRARARRVSRASLIRSPRPRGAKAELGEVADTRTILTCGRSVKGIAAPTVMHREIAVAAAERGNTSSV